MVHELPDLPYPYDALEPHIDERTMRIHHDKHHQGYVDNLNQVLKNYPRLQEKDVKDLLADLDVMPVEIRTVVRDHGGGHYNHSLFWQVMSPHGGGKPQGKLAKSLSETFGSLDNFKEKFTDTAVSHFGSGWGWLVIDEGLLKLTSTPNQFSPLSQGQIPLLGVDVWEHAYYLKYQNRRGDYLQAFFEVINWDQVQQNYTQALA